MPSPGAGGLSQREDRPNGGSQRRRAQWTGEPFKEHSTQRGALAILAQQGFRYLGPRTQMGVVTATNLALCHRCMRGVRTRMVGRELPRRAPPTTGVDSKILDLDLTIECRDFWGSGVSISYMWEGQASQPLRGQTVVDYMLLRNIDSLPLPSIEGKQFPTKVTADGFGHVTCFGQKNELFHGAEQRPKEDLHSPASSLAFQLLPQEGSGQVSSTLAAGGRGSHMGLIQAAPPKLIGLAVPRDALPSPAWSSPRSVGPDSEVQQMVLVLKLHGLVCCTTVAAVS